MTTIVTMPSLGESIVEGTIGKWLVKEGDVIKKDQPVVEVMTDKADTEVPAPAGGVVSKILAPAGEVIAIGAPLCEIEPAAAGTATKVSAPPPAKVAEAPKPPVEAPSSPSVRKLAREQGVDLKTVEGSGPSGRLTKGDVLRATETTNRVEAIAAPRPVAEASAPKAATKSAFQVPPYLERAGDEVISFSRRRKIIADHMVYSKLTSPHVVTVAECDLHKASKLRDAHKDALKKEGIGLTFLAFIASATVRALRENRSMNARVLEDSYVLLRDINLGIAVETPDGLVVPVIKHADELSVRGIARGIDEVALRARQGKLTPDDLAGKTFTISNPGRKGNMFGGAIISQPNVGILRIGEITKRVVVVEHEDEDLLAIHPVMHMALSYDHRIVDGVAANAFLWRVVEILEQADFEL